jgi:hypothetical protein
VTSVNGFARDPSWRPLRDDEDALDRDAPSSSSAAYYWKK